MTKRTIRAWAVLTPEMGGRGPCDYLKPWGNGDEFQYPLFPKRKEALAWEHRNTPYKDHVVRVTIQIETKGT